jgi:hypothetical protein
MIVRGLDNRDTDDLFLVLARILQQDGGSFDYFRSVDILPPIIRRRSGVGMMLLAKLSLIIEVAKAIRQSEAMEWCFACVERDDIDFPIIESTLIVLINVISLKDLGDIEWSDERVAIRVFETLVPLVVAFHSTKPSIVVHAFPIFGDCLENATDKALEMKLLRLASVLLVVHIDSPEIVTADVTFLYKAAYHGLTEQMKEIPKLLVNVMNAKKRYSNRQLIVERCAGISFLVDRVNGAAHHTEAFRQFPQSEFLKNLLKCPAANKPT